MADNFHNSLGGNSADQLRAYVIRIERLEAEIAELNNDKKDIYAEVKACGFNKKALRKLIMRRKKDTYEVQEEDELLDTYETAVHAAETATKDPLA